MVSITSPLVLRPSAARTHGAEEDPPSPELFWGRLSDGLRRMTPLSTMISLYKRDSRRRNTTKMGLREETISGLLVAAAEAGIHITSPPFIKDVARVARDLMREMERDAHAANDGEF